MILTFRPIKVWPAGWEEPGRTRGNSPFSATYDATLRLLDDELSHLGATGVSLQVAASERDCRLDGQLRANARVTHPGVILTVETKQHGTLVYACDRFQAATWKRNALAGWQVNLRAIALGLEALRKVERYGIAERGQQYAGYRELGAGTPMGPATSTMTVEEAARFIAAHSDSPEDRLVDVEADPFFATALYREAAKRLHPDAGGDPELFKRLVEAKDVLDRLG